MCIYNTNPNPCYNCPIILKKGSENIPKNNLTSHFQISFQEKNITLLAVQNRSDTKAKRIWFFLLKMGHSEPQVQNFCKYLDRDIMNTDLQTHFIYFECCFGPFGHAKRIQILTGSSVLLAANSDLSPWLKGTLIWYFRWLRFSLFLYYKASLGWWLCD